MPSPNQENSSEDDSEDLFCIALRFRPLINFEAAFQFKNSVSVDKDNGRLLILDEEKGGKNSFVFNNIFVETDTNEKIWDTIGYKNTYQAWKEDYNSVFLCLGLPGSGKSYTTFGPPNYPPVDKPDSKQFGMCYRFIDTLFSNEKFGAKNPLDVPTTLNISMLSLHNEKLQDLLAPTNKVPLQLRYTQHTGTYIEGQTWNLVNSMEEFESVFRDGLTVRALTNEILNDAAIVIITLKITQFDNRNDTSRTRYVKFIEMGSYDQTPEELKMPDRMKNVMKFDRSWKQMQYLADICQSHDKRSAKKTREECKASVLTYLLKDFFFKENSSFMNPTKYTFIATCSPSEHTNKETIKVLKAMDALRYHKVESISKEEMIKNKIPILDKEIVSIIGKDLKSLEKEAEELAQNENTSKFVMEKLKGKILTYKSLKATFKPSRELFIKETKKLVEKRKYWFNKQGIDMRDVRFHRFECAIAALSNKLKDKKDKEREEEKEFFGEDKDVMDILYGDGDSFNEGEEVDYANQFADRLEEEMKQAQQESEIKQASKKGRDKLKPPVPKSCLDMPFLVRIWSDPYISAGAISYLNPGDTWIGRIAPKAEDDAFFIKIDGPDINKRMGTIIYKKNEGTVWYRVERGQTVFLNGRQLIREFDHDPPVQLFHGQVLAFGKRPVLFAVNIGKEKVSFLSNPHIEEVKKLNVSLNFEKERQKLNEKAITENFQKGMDEYKALCHSLKNIPYDDEELKELSAMPEKNRKQMNEYREKIIEANMKEVQVPHVAKQMYVVLREKISNLIYLIQEANSIAFDIEGLYYFELVFRKRPDAEKMISANFLPNILPIEPWAVCKSKKEEIADVLWNPCKLKARVALIKEMLPVFRSCGNNAEKFRKYYPADLDPYYDSPTEKLIGVAYCFVEILYNYIEMHEVLQIMDDKGRSTGELEISIIPTLRKETQNFLAASRGVQWNDDETNLKTLMDEKILFTFHMKNCRNLPRKMSKDVFVSFRFFLEKFPVTTLRCPYVTQNPVFNQPIGIEYTCSDDLINYLKSQPIEMEVWGAPESELTEKIVPDNNPLVCDSLLLSTDINDDDDNKNDPEEDEDIHDVEAREAKIQALLEQKDELTRELRMQHEYQKKLETKVKNEASSNKSSGSEAKQLRVALEKARKEIEVTNEKMAKLQAQKSSACIIS